jgi:phage anti-repressor protein
MDAKTFVKRMTAVPEKFVDEIFDLYTPETVQTDIIINLDYVAKWLGTQKKELMKTLRTSYKQNIDYICTRKVKNPNQTDKRANNYVHCLITPDCFKRLAMMSKAKNADLVRTYFIEIETLFIKHRDHIISGMQAEIDRLHRNQRPMTSASKGDGMIYVIKASPLHDSVVKLGRSTNLRARLTNHMSSHADDFEVLYVYKCFDVEAVESCVKRHTKPFKYRKYKEVYKIELEYLKKLIQRCDNFGRLEVMYQKRKALKFSQDGGYYMALYPGSNSLDTLST